MSETENLTWQQVEAEVQRIAESVWAVNASPKLEAGIKCDIILKIRRDYWIMIEVSKRNGLGKIRDDIAKLSAVRLACMSKQIYCECYFITRGESHPSLVETGESCNVQVFNLVDFASKFVAAREYINERRLSPFGSAVDPDEGTVDKAAYTPISYADGSGKRYSHVDIEALLRKGEKVVLLGEFGTGKSRCLMEIFENLSKAKAAFVPFAINLRDNWGYGAFSHIIQNHLDSLGLGEFSGTLVRSLRRGNHILLLDGFDEIGSQSWSGDPARLTETRMKSLEGVRDLVSNCRGSGILLTGREHYFSSDDEMVECLGLSRDRLLILRCPNEFTEAEAAQYIHSNTKLRVIPEWMPRKPLICQLLALLDPDQVESLNERATGEVEFFESVFDSICNREGRIRRLISKDALKNILLLLAQNSRKKAKDAERITTGEINHAVFQCDWVSTNRRVRDPVATLTLPRSCRIRKLRQDLYRRLRQRRPSWDGYDGGRSCVR